MSVWKIVLGTLLTIPITTRASQKKLAIPATIIGSLAIDFILDDDTHSFAKGAAIGNIIAVLPKIAGLKEENTTFVVNNGIAPQQNITVSNQNTIESNNFDSNLVEGNTETKVAGNLVALRNNNNFVVSSNDFFVIIDELTRDFQVTFATRIPIHRNDNKVLFDLKQTESQNVFSTYPEFIIAGLSEASLAQVLRVFNTSSRVTRIFYNQKRTSSTLFSAVTSLMNKIAGTFITVSSDEIPFSVISKFD